MTRTRVAHLGATLAFALVFAVAPLSAQASNATFFGPIVPPECNCTDQANPNGGTIDTAPSYGCVLATVENAVNFGITIGVVAATLALVFAGFTWMTSVGNPEARSKGRTMLINVFVGLLILLSAWLVVDFIMKKLYNSTSYGPWNSILGGDADVEYCIVATNAEHLSGLAGGLLNGIVGSEGGAGTIGTGGSGSAGGGQGTGPRCSAPAPNLVTIDSAGHKLADGVAQRFIAMRTAAAAAGVTLRVTYAYRSDDEQNRIWTDTHCQNINGRNSCNGIVAGPCQQGFTGSNHLLGNAVDITNCTSGNILPWLRANARNYQFYNNLPRDLCHWSTTGG